MGIFSKFEDKMEDTVDAAASRMSKAPISPVQIAKRAEREMRRETMVGAGKEYAPTLYTVLVNPEDDARLFGYYPTLAGETETYLKAKAVQEGLVMDGNPLVRFIVDDGLRHGKFDIIAETVSGPIIAQLREEEMERYGLAQKPAAPAAHHGNSRKAAHPAPETPHTATYAQGNVRGGHETARAQLIDLSTQRPYDLGGSTIVMGRDAGCDIVVNDISASRRHAELRRDQHGQWIVTDLDSTNGTMVNGRRIASQPLYLGDVITIGKTDYELADAD